MTPARLPPTAAFPPTYQRRQLEDTLLYQTIADNLDTFVQNTAEQGGHLPWFVRRALAAHDHWHDR